MRGLFVVRGDSRWNEHLTPAFGLVAGTRSVEHSRPRLCVRQSRTDAVRLFVRRASVACEAIGETNR